MSKIEPSTELFLKVIEYLLDKKGENVQEAENIINQVIGSLDCFEILCNIIESSNNNKIINACFSFLKKFFRVADFSQVSDEIRSSFLNRLLSILYNNTDKELEDFCLYITFLLYEKIDPCTDTFLSFLDTIEERPALFVKIALIFILKIDRKAYLAIHQRILEKVVLLIQDDSINNKTHKEIFIKFLNICIDSKIEIPEEYNFRFIVTDMFVSSLTNNEFTLYIECFYIFKYFYEYIVVSRIQDVLTKYLIDEITPFNLRCVLMDSFIYFISRKDVELSIEELPFVFEAYKMLLQQYLTLDEETEISPNFFLTDLSEFYTDTDLYNIISNISEPLLSSADFNEKIIGVFFLTLGLQKFRYMFEEERKDIFLILFTNLAHKQYNVSYLCAEMIAFVSSNLVEYIEENITMVLNQMFVYLGRCSDNNLTLYNIIKSISDVDKIFNEAYIQIYQRLDGNLLSIYIECLRLLFDKSRYCIFSQGIEIFNQLRELFEQDKEKYSELLPVLYNILDQYSSMNTKNIEIFVQNTIVYLQESVEQCNTESIISALRVIFQYIRQYNKEILYDTYEYILTLAKNIDTMASLDVVVSVQNLCLKIITASKLKPVEIFNENMLNTYFKIMDNHLNFIFQSRLISYVEFIITFLILINQEKDKLNLFSYSILKDNIGEYYVNAVRLSLEYDYLNNYFLEIYHDNPSIYGPFIKRELASLLNHTIRRGSSAFLPLFIMYISNDNTDNVGSLLDVVYDKCFQLLQSPIKNENLKGIKMFYIISQYNSNISPELSNIFIVSVTDTFRQAPPQFVIDVCTTFCDNKLNSQCDDFQDLLNIVYRNTFEAIVERVEQDVNIKNTQIQHMKECLLSFLCLIFFANALEFDFNILGRLIVSILPIRYDYRNMIHIMKAAYHSSIIKQEVNLDIKIGISKRLIQQFAVPSHVFKEKYNNLEIPYQISCYTHIKKIYEGTLDEFVAKCLDYDETLISLFNNWRNFIENNGDYRYLESSRLSL